MKELYLQCQEELVEELAEKYPTATDDWLWEAASCLAEERMKDKLADMIDYQRDLRKEGRISG